MSAKLILVLCMALFAAVFATEEMKPEPKEENMKTAESHHYGFYDVGPYGPVYGYRSFPRFGVKTVGLDIGVPYYSGFGVGKFGLNLSL